MTIGGHRFVQRNFGHERRFFLHHDWNGRHFYTYFHGWRYENWFWRWYGSPFGYHWRWEWPWLRAPWCTDWSWYWEPYADYDDPIFWVTDYVMGEMLAEAYQDGYRSKGQGTGISAPDRDQLRKQVGEIGQNYQNEISPALEQAFQDPEYIFVVDINLSVLNEDKQKCHLSAGDLLKVAQAPREGDKVANMRVISTKDLQCPAGSTVQVSFEDLQEMLNAFAQKVDDGMNKTQDLQRKGQIHQ
ncbi:MAG: hypothetical protein C5B49_04040 [Bdellovibrio sp.]|nr:MAG: hypothetical protein C5B49_04040 [Bdellovibrio sp.]